MLSYRHAFHAGNFADVIKHVVLVEILQHLGRKAAPYAYIDTHAGAGMYDLGSAAAMKLQEHLAGVGKLFPPDWPELELYFSILESFNPTNTLQHYPGSPLIAHALLREQDRAWLFELHPADFAALRQNMSREPNIQVRNEDGFQGLLALVPPPQRRGVVLIDPSYEVKGDYARVGEVLARAWKKFSTGIYLVWYPVVRRQRVVDMENAIASHAIRNVQRFELAVAADSATRGMTAAGLIVVNPPWRLMERMRKVLPRLANTLGLDSGAGFKADVLAEE